MHALILWHHYDNGGIITNASMTKFRGCSDDLIQLLEEQKGNNVITEKEGKGPIVAHQILVIDHEPF